VGIERFVWTEHAEDRLRQRRLNTSDVEQAIVERHAEREVNDGRAEWLIGGRTPQGIAFEAIYDHPPRERRECRPHRFRLEALI
jgi:hypothetical protein